MGVQCSELLAGHDMDLNLRISQPAVHNQRGNQNPTGVQFEASDADKTSITHLPYP